MTPKERQRIMARIVTTALSERPDLGPMVYRGSCVAGAMNWQVTIDDEPLKVRLDLVNHSPDGFAWGYFGSGPAQLACALLADYYRQRAVRPRDADRWAVEHHQDFKTMFVAQLEKNTPWAITLAEMDEAVRTVLG
jgi:hypothetical protein